MKAIEIGGMTCQLYRNLRTETPSGETTIRDLLTGTRFKQPVEYLREVMRISKNLGVPDERRAEMKREIKLKELNAVMVTAVCGENKSQITEERPIVCLDFDFADNPEAFKDETNTIKVKKWLCSMPMVYGAALSCSGKGVFAVVVLEGVDDYKMRVDSLFEYFSGKGLFPDKACNNKNRARYVSFDYTPCVKGDDEEIVPWSEKKRPSFIQSFGNAAREIMVRESELHHKTDADRNMFESPGFFLKAVDFVKGYYGVDCTKYQAWLYWGCVCATFPDQSAGLEAFKILSEEWPAEKHPYDEQEVEEKFEESLKLVQHSPDEYVAIYGQCKKYAGTGWVRQVKEHDYGCGGGLKGLK